MIKNEANEKRFKTKDSSIEKFLNNCIVGMKSK